MARSIKINDPFARTVEAALEHFADAVWLGTHSPLAAPYFLGDALEGRADAELPAGRGSVLQSVLLFAAQTLPHEQQHVLATSFFKRNSALNNVGVAMALNMSETTYYRRRANAIEALADEVNRAVLPPWRMDMPHAPPLVNRAAALTACLDLLHRRSAVALSGPGGIGKTALGAALAQRWPERRAFWYTIRPSLNDQFGAVAFALAHFLRSHGAASTWRQLIADRGVADPARTVTLLRHDLAQTESAGRSLVICMDEVDLLRDERGEHAQVIHLLESLRGAVPMVWIGQQVLIEADQHHVLVGLNVEEVAAMLAKKGLVGLPTSEVEAVHAHTRGNPALISLVANLRRVGERLTDVLQLIASVPSVEPLLNRIWKRVNDDERGVLMALAVFNGAAPRDAWPGHQSAFDALIARELAQASQGGSIQLPSYVREFVRRRMPADVAARLNVAAAEVFESRGEYTTAAYHYLCAGQPQLALWTWFNHRQLEVERGHAPAARELFRRLSEDDFSDPDDRRALALLRAEHFLAAGAADEAEIELRRASWPITLPATAYARQLQGDAHEMQGRIEQALEQYRAAWRVLDALPDHRMVSLRVKAGYIYINRAPDLTLARREAVLALWQAHNFMGHVEQESGHYAEAQAHYEVALRLARQIEHGANAQARTQQHLGALFLKMGHGEEAIHHLEAALRSDERAGDAVSVLYDQLNLSSAYIVAQRYDDALRTATLALPTAQDIGHGFLVTGFFTCAAEASFYLNQLAEAERFTVQALREEEEAFRPYALTVLGQVRAAQGRFDEAERILAQAIEGAQASGDRFAEVAAWKAVGEMRAGRADPEQTQQAYENALRLYRELGLASEEKAIQAKLAGLAADA